jgi:hypothetical protein
MTIKPNAVIPAEEPKRKKRGGQPGNTNAPVPVGLAGVGSSTASTPKTSLLPNAGAYTQRVLFEQTTAFFNTLDHVLQELSDERKHNGG